MSAAAVAFASTSVSPVGATETRASLAFGRPAISANVPCTLNSGPNKAVDGLGADINKNKWCAQPLLGHSTLTIDLGRLYRIEEVAVYHAGYAENGIYNTRDFQLQLSGDGLSWYHTVSVTNSNAAVTRHDMLDLPARFVRLDITKATQTSSNIARIYEVYVIGYNIN
jgi:hypothetical protein